MATCMHTYTYTYIQVPVYRPVESERRITKKLAPVRDNSGIIGRDADIDRLREHCECVCVCMSVCMCICTLAGTLI